MPWAISEDRVRRRKRGIEMNRKEAKKRNGGSVMNEAGFLKIINR